MSKETPIWSSAVFSVVKLTFWMSGRPSMVGLIAFAGSTRDSAMEKAAGWIIGAGVADVIVAGVVDFSTTIGGSMRRCPAKYDPPGMITRAAAPATHPTAAR